jgi:hypothetical protein
VTLLPARSRRFFLKPRASAPGVSIVACLSHERRRGNVTRKVLTILPGDPKQLMVPGDVFSVHQDQVVEWRRFEKKRSTRDRAKISG